VGVQLTWLLADEGLPANWRCLEGYSVNTFLLINDKGEERYVKFHWRPKEGEPPPHHVRASDFPTFLLGISSHKAAAFRQSLLKCKPTSCS
jgi:hypothetical protein